MRYKNKSSMRDTKALLECGKLFLEETLVGRSFSEEHRSQGQDIRQTHGHPTTAPEPAHFRLWGAWGHPKALSSSGLSWILSVCRHRGRHQFFRSRRAKPLWASWMLRVCRHRGRHRLLHSRRAKPLGMHRFLMAGV
jgi:hypothetical protein